MTSMAANHSQPIQRGLTWQQTFTNQSKRDLHGSKPLSTNPKGTYMAANLYQPIQSGLTWQQTFINQSKGDLHGSKPLSTNPEGTYMAANQPVSLSWALSSWARVRRTSSECTFCSRRLWPSRLVARQLRAKQAFLLAPASSQLSILAKEEI